MRFMRLMGIGPSRSHVVSPVLADLTLRPNARRCERCAARSAIRQVRRADPPTTSTKARVVPSHQVRDRPPPPPEATEKPGGKGRPTPTRKEAEAAAKARAKVPRTRKEQAAAQRAHAASPARRCARAMKTGDERYLLPRDKGPVRRFIRDFVDRRFSLHRADDPAADRDHGARLLRQRRPAPASATPSCSAPILLVVVDMLLLRLRLRASSPAGSPTRPPRARPTTPSCARCR